MIDISVEHSYNTSIPECMGIWTSLRGQDHDIAVCARINRILCLPDVICRIVNLEDLCRVDTVVFKMNSVMIGC